MNACAPGTFAAPVTSATGYCAMIWSDSRIGMTLTRALNAGVASEA
jgi:hypothetical protein